MPYIEQLAGITVPVIQPAEEEPAPADSKETVMDLSTTYLGMRLPAPADRRSGAAR